MGHSLLHDYILGGEITLSSSNMISKIVPLTDIVVRHNILKCWLNAFNYTNRKLLQMRTNFFFKWVPYIYTGKLVKTNILITLVHRLFILNTFTCHAQKVFWPSSGLNKKNPPMIYYSCFKTVLELASLFTNTFKIDVHKNPIPNSALQSFALELHSFFSSNVANC